MTRLSVRIGAVLSLAALAGTAACTQNAFTPVSITTTEAVVAGCQKVGQIDAKTTTASPDVNDELTAAARKQGANYVVLASEGARTGVAYRCQTPTAPGAASMTPGSSSK
ncbi:MAG TPA: hypothetical protein VE007_06655 [Thermoanaerobaculia bacterium]|nr:hypothetical protein [Thermoanaerobaculia bacterium]